MKDKLHRQLFAENRKNITATEQQDQVKGVFETIKHVRLVENQRTIKIKNLLFEYRQKIEKDKKRMQMILEEKKVIQKNCEEENQKIILNIL